MGRLPSTWADRAILDRIPYSIAGEIVLASGQLNLQYPENTFSNNTDKPFEIHRMIPRMWALTDAEAFLAAASQPDQTILGGLARLTVNDLGLNQILTKNPALISTLLKGTAELSWEFADPHYLVRGNQIQVIADALAYTGIVDTFTNMRIGLVFQGFLLVVAPPSENR